MKEGRRGDTAVFILGAGATRGASFADPRKAPCLPPFDSDFFTQLQRVRNPKHQDLISEVIKDTIEIFGVNFHVTLENVFTTLEHTLRMVTVTGENHDFKQAELKRKRDRLLQAVAAVMEESLTEKRGPGRGSLRARCCDYHKTFVETILNPAEQIISFNYDCLIDYSLKKFGAGKWNSHFGYGFNLGSHGANVKGDKDWQPSQPASKGASVKLYKLHGSLHFNIADEKKVRFKSRPYTKQQGNLRFTVIPPEYHKAYDKGVFLRLWKKAGEALHQASDVVLIGYSLPTSDLHSTALLRISVKNRALKSLVIVNPDPEARRRAQTVLQRGISDSTRILIFDGFEEFVAAERGLWDRPAVT